MLTQQEIADKIKVNVRTVQRWRKQGMPYIKKNRTIRFDLDAVMQWLESNGG